MKGKNQMKIRRLMTFFMAWFVMLNFCPQMTFADEIYDKCVIPIISDKSEKLTWDGLKKDGTFYVTLEDACILTGAEVVKQSNDNFVAERNTVKLFGDINDNEACLCVAELDALLFSWDGEALKYPQAGLTNRILYKQPFHLDMTCFEGKVWVDLFSYANCFGADINILTEDSESYKYLGEINLTEFDGCYTIETGTPFDEIYTEFMNHSELQFEWIDWGQEVGVFVAKGYNAVINEYKNVFNYAFEDYDSTKTYRDVLLNIIECRTGHFSDNSFIEDMEKYQEDSEKEMNAIFFTLDSILDDDNPFQKQIKKELGDAKSIVSGTKEFTDVIYQYSKLAYNINKMNEVEIMLLEKSILDDNARDEEAYNSKNAAANVDDFADIIKKVLPSVGESMESSATKFQKIIEDYASLYDSAEKLNNEIQSYEKLTEDALTEIANNLWVMLCDYALGETMDNVAPKTKSILDVFDFAVGQMKSDTMASVSDSAQAHFIQKTVLKNVKLDKSDTSYYSLLMAMQSSYMANKNIMTIDANVSPEQATLAVSDDLKRENILFQLEDLITKAYTCNRNFYNSPETNRKNIPDYSISTELYKKEPAVPINWHLDPTIEAEDIIVSDEYSNNNTDSMIDPYDECAIIQQNGKYGIIKYDGSYIAESKYNKYFCDGVYEISVFNEYRNDGAENVNVFPAENKLSIEVNYEGGRGNIEYKYIYDSSSKQIYCLSSTSSTVKKYTENSCVLVEYYDFDIIGEYNKEYDEYKIKERYEKIDSSKPKYGIAKDGKLLVQCEYEDGCMNFSDGVVALKKDGKWGYFDDNGNQIIDFICEPFTSKILYGGWWKNTSNITEYPFLSTNGYIPVKIDDQCGYYNTQGNEVIPCGTFEEVRPVHNGLAWVKKDGKWGVIKLKKIETETNTGDNNSYVNIKDYEGTYYPTNSEYHVYLEISNVVEHSANVYIGITNNRGTRVSENTYIGNITNNTITFETQDGFGKNQFTLEFEDNKIYLTGKCIELDDFANWAIPELSRLEMQLSNKQEPINKQTEPTKEQSVNSSMSDNEILYAVNKYLEENQNHLGDWLSDSGAYCPAEYMASNSTNWSCPINNYEYKYSPTNYIAGSYPYYAFVDKETLTCTITANYYTEAEFNLSNYLN